MQKNCATSRSSQRQSHNQNQSGMEEVFEYVHKSSLQSMITGGHKQVLQSYGCHMISHMGGLNTIVGDRSAGHSSVIELTTGSTTSRATS